MSYKVSYKKKEGNEQKPLKKLTFTGKTRGSYDKKLDNKKKKLSSELFFLFADLVGTAYNIGKYDFRIVDHIQLPEKGEQKVGDHLILIASKGDIQKGTEKVKDLNRILRINARDKTMQEIAHFTEKPKDIVLESSDDFENDFWSMFGNEYEQELKNLTKGKMRITSDMQLKAVNNVYYKNRFSFSLSFEGTILMVSKLKLLNGEDRVFLSTRKYLDCYNNSAKWMWNMTFGEMYEEATKGKKVKYEVGHSYQLVLRHPYNQIVWAGISEPEIYLTKHYEFGIPKKKEKLVKSNEWMIENVPRKYENPEYIIIRDQKYAEVYTDASTGIKFMPIPVDLSHLKGFIQGYDVSHTYGEILFYDAKMFPLKHYILRSKMNDMIRVSNSYSIDELMKKHTKEGLESFMEVMNVSAGTIVGKMKEILEKHISEKVDELIDKMNSMTGKTKEKVLEELAENVEDELTVMAIHFMFDAKDTLLKIGDQEKTRIYLYDYVMKNQALVDKMFK